MKHKLTVTSVATMAFDNQVVRMENENVSIDLRLKNQSDHHSYVNGDTVEVSIGEGAAPKARKSKAPKGKARK